jgi:hypothetical protein
MTPSAHPTSDRLKKIIQDEMNPDKHAREVLEQVEDGEEFRNPANTSAKCNYVIGSL